MYERTDMQLATQTKELNVEKYVGISYEVNGRDMQSVDCYGLVYLIYKNELGIDLPSFAEDGIDANRTQELIAMYKEGWEPTENIQAGDVVIFRIMGIEAHIALAIDSERFIHARIGYNSAIERFDSSKWKTRFVGSYRYSPKKSVVLNGIPHPLRTERITTAIPAGTNVLQLQDWVLKEYNIAETYKPLINIFVNGVRIPEEMKASTVLLDTDVVEYRVVAQGGGGLRTLLTVAVFIAVAVYAPQLGTYLAGAGASTGAIAGYTAASSIGLTAVGTALVDAVAPVRQPQGQGPAANNPGSAESQLIINGGANQATPYGAIPFVLGRVRLTPPLGANTYNLFSADGKESYLRMLLVWGYGPLFVDESTLQIGELPISNYQGITQETLTRITEPTAQELANFDGLYGTDITQVASGVELTCDGTASSNSVPAGPWLNAVSTDGSAMDFTVAIHFGQGCRRINSKTGDSSAAPVTFEIEYKLQSAVTWTGTGTHVVGTSPVKDAFTWTKKFTTNSSVENVQVRIRRLTGTGTGAPDDLPSFDLFGVPITMSKDFQYTFLSTLVNVTFSRNTKPAIDPINCKIAKTAFEIKASDQLNGQIEGINAICWTYGKSWNGTAWVAGNINNPAALFRHVLEHPANPRRVTDAANKINLVQLQAWHDYCTAKGFTYNSVVGAQRSVLDILRDICAAGRASPAMVDGKWTVVIDEAKPNVVQHFTPHNSWGFEGTKSLPRIPDGLRVTFVNEDKNWQEDETIVYAAANSASNAALLESISVPGVTKLSQAIDHARWHMAQVNLRPERYTLNTDIEYIVCNRGDRVKVMHDVPMWGLGSGRIKNRLSATTFELTEELPMQAGFSYSIRVRGKSGASTVRQIQSKPADGYYDEITITASATAAEIDNDDLFLFGENQQEAQDCVVLSIEPQDNKTARLTLVDYGITSGYNIFTDYLNYTNDIAFESQISIAPKLLIQSFGTKVPTITGIISDERVMQKIAAGVFQYNMQVSYTNAAELPAKVTSVDFQWDYNSAVDDYGARSKQVKYNAGSVLIPDVDEGSTMKVRCRYVGEDGRTGVWSAYSTNTIVGKTNPPSQVQGFTAVADLSISKIKLAWVTNPEPDIKVYEVRTDLNWGTDSNLVFRGDATSCLDTPASAGVVKTYYIKALDYSDNYSSVHSTTTFTVVSPSNVNSVSYVFADTSLTAATVTINWNFDTASTFGLKGYEVTYEGQTKFINASSITLPANWIGERTFTITVVDLMGNKSTGYILQVIKQLPNPCDNFRAQVIDNTVMFYWNLPAVTTLPVDHVLLKKGATWETADIIGEKKGAFTTQNETQGGTYTYWIAAVDTDDNESAPVSLTAAVEQPPDFVFFANFVSDFNATKVNTVKESNTNHLILPVNTSETFQQHFTDNAWGTPQDQVNAGYPIYIQPTEMTGYYEETFDFGTILSSSKVTLVYQGTVVVAPVVISTSISVSADGSTWQIYDGVSGVFATSFRYVRVKLQVASGADKGLYNLEYLAAKLDSKVISDAGGVVCDASDTLGTIVNFNKEFADVNSIVVSPQGTTAIIPVYDFKDVVASGTYSVTSNVCTVNVTGHELITGQNVRIGIASGVGLLGVYTITSHSTNSFTVNMTAPDTSGNLSIYPESFRVYLFSTLGVRLTANASWSVTGY